MSIADVITRLQTLHATISGVVSAPTAYPTVLNTTDLPLVLTWPGPGSSHQEAMGSLRRQDRTYIVRCYVKPVSQGVGIDEAIQACIPILQSFIEAYINPANIALANPPVYQETIQISSTHPVTDQGISVLPYGSGAAGEQVPTYHGFELKVGIYEKW